MLKKVTIVSIISAIYMIIASLIGYFTKNTTIVNPLIMLLIGGGCGIFSLLIYALLKKYKIGLYLSLFLSANALGFMIRSWYIFRGFENKLWVMILVSLSCVLCLWIYYFLLKIPFFKEHQIGFSVIALIFSLIIYIVLIINTETTFISTFGYYMIVEIGFIFALYMNATDYHELLKNIVKSSYAIFIVAIIILIIILLAQGGDFDVDLSGSGGGYASSRKKKRTRSVK